MLKQVGRREETSEMIRKFAETQIQTLNVLVFPYKRTAMLRYNNHEIRMDNSKVWESHHVISSSYCLPLPPSHLFNIFLSSLVTVIKWKSDVM